MVDFLPGSAWDTWRKAGAEFARKCLERRLSVVPLGEEAHQYAASRGLAHQDVIRRAFVEGYNTVPTQEPLYCEFCGPGASCCGVCGRGIVA